MKYSFLGRGEATNRPLLLCKGCLHILTQGILCQAATPATGDGVIPPAVPLFFNFPLVLQKS